MLVFWKAKIVLLAVPKTGSTALAEAYGPLADMVIRTPPELKHAPVYRYNRFFRPMFERVGGAQMTLVAAIRDPLDWLGSWYRYRQRPFLDGAPTSTSAVSFDAFVDAYLQKERPAFADVGSQAKFLEPRPNGIAVDRVYRYEALDALTGFLDAQLGVTTTLQRRNESGSAPAMLDPSLSRRLRRRCAQDFALWEAARTTP